MTDWRVLPYGDKEFALVPDSLRSASWMERELVLPLGKALEAVEHFRAAGVQRLCWEGLHGYPDSKLGGGFSIDGKNFIISDTPEWDIAEVAQTMCGMDAELRPHLEPKGECLLFCLMILDGAA